MYCISINHKNSKTEIREKFTLDEKQQKQFLELAGCNEKISSCVILMTCNRSEIYFTSLGEEYKEIQNIFQKVKKTNVQNYKKNLMRYEGKVAITHLYKVICGLDSAVLGEVEIIRQVKKAYEFATINKTVNSEINQIFQGALQLAKEIADKSLMTRLPVSVGTLTTNEVMDFIKDINEPKVLLVGASGDIGTIVMRDISDACDKVKIIGTSRKHKVNSLEFKDTDRLKWIHYDKRYEYVNQADVIISATNSPHYTFFEEQVKEQIKDNKKRLFIDLAVPRDIDEELEKSPNIILRNMDYIKLLARENNEKKVSEAKRVEGVIMEKVEEIEKVLLFSNYMKNTNRIEQLKNKDSMWLLYKLKDNLDFNSLNEVLKILEEEI